MVILEFKCDALSRESMVEDRFDSYLGIYIYICFNINS